MAELATSLLATKLFIPPALPGLVSRPRLMERMRVALNYGLTLISAPAGSGKTTLASDWVRHIQRTTSAAWLSLDDGDNDPTRFWDYLIAALKTVRPGAGEAALSLLRSNQPYTPEALLTSLINDLASIPDELVLVLDDYHLVNTEAINTGVTFLLEHLPPKMHVVIATRTEPPLPLSTFRGRGTMLEIAPDDLRFTLDETTALLKDMQNLELPSEEVSVLNERTEGWAVGLTMAALSIGKQRDAHAFIASFAGSQRHIMEYLADEVLKRQRDEVRDFLLKTSILERLNGPLCEDVSGRAGGQVTLERLEKANLFLVPLDESGEWYRYHHLFAELLRHQLEGACDAEEIRQLHRRASQWYEGHNYPDDAIRHSLKIQDWERATELIEKAADGLIKRGEWNTLSGWFQAVPQEVLRAHPVAYAHYANVLTTLGRLEAAEAVLAYLEGTPDLEERLRGQLAFFRMEMASHRGDIKQTMELAERAAEQLGEENGAMRARATYVLGVLKESTWCLDEAQSLFGRALEFCRQCGDRWIGAAAASHMGTVLWLRGRLREAVNFGQQAIELAGQSPAAGVPGFGQAIRLYELNDLNQAARCARLAIVLGEPGGYGGPPVSSYCLLAIVQLAQGDAAGARVQLGKGDEIFNHPAIPPSARTLYAALRVMVALWQDDLRAALDWGNRLPEYSHITHGCQHVPARLLIAKGETAAAAGQLRDLYQNVVQGGAQGYAIRIRVCQALAAATQNEALDFLADALKMGEPEGFIRTFVDEGRLLAPLLRQAVRSGIEPEYARKLLAIIQAEEQRRQAATAKGVPIPESSEFLSQRELEVLRLAAEGMSNRQIAEKLTVTLSTAKAHVHNITGKLGARSRTQAIARARELKLI